MDQHKKEFKPYTFRIGTKSHTNNNYNKPGTTTRSGIKGTRTSNSGWNNTMKEVKCWGCNRHHIYRNCPHNPTKQWLP